ncbi:MAG: AAA family ATPase, partial [Kofleriaceae bacterium]|nr:AAA family ATPase [Kofleriaceae bacterium]
MKILAIRGQNLASLAGRFEVSLADDPLAGAGLFAIVGETGAGKTTLLDAMCAALFDKTPRLEGHSGFKVGHGDDERLRLGTSDVRALVTSGEAAGWAEVDFEGRDRRRYRARWEVQRARKRLDGRWQDQRMKLVRLDDGVVLGGTRTETLTEIRRALGLSYDEFCRSALLAQFQFARFLKASASERAELLERMTGTRVYGDVSRAAFRRAAALGEERRRLGEAAAAIAVLDDEAR